MDTKNIQFAICLSSEKDDDFEIGKVYPVLPDSKAEAVGCLRVIDESGEDYLYSKSRFITVPLPKAVIDRVYFQNLI